jgi:hypothetical protein
MRKEYTKVNSIRLAAVVLIGAAMAALPTAGVSAQSTTLLSSEHIIATLYAYPGTSQWPGVVDNAPTISAAIADMCTADGYGSGCNGQPWDEQPPAAWTTQINALREAGITPLIYIATDYGDQGGNPNFSLATVESEVKDAVGWYGTGIGFMFDEAATSCSLESSYYAPLYSYVKSMTHSGEVELNPGTVSSTMSCYMSASDVLQVFEGSEASFQTATFPSWMAGYQRSRFAATISAGTATGVGTDVSDAARDGIGNVYVDDEAEPPNYSTLPSFWSAEVADVAAVPASGVASQHSLVPLYAAPTSSYWTTLDNSAPTARSAIVDICAPDGTGSGCDGMPADEANPAWPPTIQAMLKAGVLPLYYISTNYGSVAISTVESEINDAISWYGTPSIMLDEVPTSCSNLSYYQTLYNYIHSQGGISVLDPGTVTSTSSCYMPSADVLEMFTGSQSSFQTATFPSWLTGYPASRFGAAVSAGTSSGVATDVSDAAAKNIGNIYVDDEAEPPTYATLPSFWSSEVADIKAEP